MIESRESDMEAQEDEFGFKEDPVVFARHPDPAWARRKWFSLDGEWNIEHSGRREKIYVPFPVGSRASGVDFYDSGEFLYSRSFDFPQFDAARRYELHVGACDYEAEVVLNGRRIGSHTGGYSSFCFDISSALRAAGNMLQIRVRDSHSPAQCRGKQTFRRHAWFVWYEGISGIWQPVWIEETGRDRLASARVACDFEKRELNIRVEAARADCGPDYACPAAREQDRREDALSLEAEIRLPDGGSKKFSSLALDEDSAFIITIKYEDIDARFWSPDTPVLYGIRYALLKKGKPVDEVESYFGIRKIETSGKSFMLNGQPLYLRMVLDQGYYPEGVYTPLNYKVVENDIEMMKKMGFNGARVHEKIESPYFHYLCDRMGLLCSCEMPSFYVSTPKSRRNCEAEFREILARDAMHPSCVLWVLFNETWGIWGIYNRGSKTRRFAERMIAYTREKDPDRPLIDNSGWEHFDTDIVDFHHYLGTAALARNLYGRFAAHDKTLFYGFSKRKALDFYVRNLVATDTRTVFLEKKADTGGKPFFLSEYGGFGWYNIAEKGSTIDKISIYTKDIVNAGVFCGYCLTQLYDVGPEVNGLMSFDRKPKMDIGQLKAINSAKPE